MPAALPILAPALGDGANFVGFDAAVRSRSRRIWYGILGYRSRFPWRSGYGCADHLGNEYSELDHEQWAGSHAAVAVHRTGAVAQPRDDVRLACLASSSVSTHRAGRFCGEGPNTGAWSPFRGGIPDRVTGPRARSGYIPNAASQGFGTDASGNRLIFRQLRCPELHRVGLAQRLTVNAWATLQTYRIGKI